MSTRLGRSAAVIALLLCGVTAPAAAAVTTATAPTTATTTATTQPASTQPATGPRQAVTEVFASQRYPFCHLPEYPLTSAEKRWCDLGAGANPACPTLAEACKREATAKHLDTDKPLTIELPDLGLPARLLLWALLAVVVVLLIVAMVRHSLDRKGKEVITTAAPSSTEDEAAAELARQVETDVQRLLERARHEAAAGDFRAAIGSVYAALLRRLEGAGVIRVEPDQTNGDYLGRVKHERPAIAARMGEVVAGVERAQFGETAVTRDNFDGVWLRVTSLLTERIGILLLACSLLAATSCGELRGDWEHSPSGRAGVIAFLGKRGFTVRERLLAVTKLGDGKPGDSKPGDGKPGDSKPSDSQTEHKPAGAAPTTAAPATQLVLLPDALMRADDWQAVKTWLDHGGRSLVVAGGRRELPTWIGARIVEGQAVAEAITPNPVDAKRWGTLKARVPGTNRVEAAGARPLLERKPSVYAAERWLGLWSAGEAEAKAVKAEGDTESEPKTAPPAGGAAETEEHEPAAAEQDERNGQNEEYEEDEEDELDEDEPADPSRVIVLADDLLWRNASLLVADNAAVLEALLKDGGTSLELIGDLTGLVAANPVESVERGRLGPALLQLAAFLVLLFVCKGARFGRPVPEPRSERRAFVEHVRALGLHYTRARAERVALAALGSYAIERLRERFGLHVDRSLSGLAEAVAARTDRPVGKVMRMFLEARDAAKAVPADNDARDLDTAWQMCRLLEETGGTGGHQRIQSHV